MVLQKVVEEGHLEVSDTLIDDNNTAIRVRREDCRQCMFSFWSDRSEMHFFSYNTPTHKNIHSHISPEGLALHNLHKTIVVMVTCLLGDYKELYSFISLSLSLADIHHHVQVDFYRGPAYPYVSEQQLDNKGNVSCSFNIKLIFSIKLPLTLANLIT